MKGKATTKEIYVTLSNFAVSITHKHKNYYLIIRSLLLLTLFIASSFLDAGFIHAKQSKIATTASGENEIKSVELNEEERSWLKNHPKIYIGLPEGLAPYVMDDNEGHQVGILVDFLDELNRTLGSNIILKTMPSSKIFEMSKNKEIDVIYALEPEKAKAENLMATDVWAIGYPAIYARKGSSFKTPEDMAGKKIVLRPNTIWDNELAKTYASMENVVYAETPLDAMKMVLNEEADLYIGLTSHTYALTKYRLFGISQAYVFENKKLPFAMGIRSDWPELVSILNKGLSAIGRKGLRKIVQKWISADKKEYTVDLSDKELAWLKAHPDITLGYTDAFEPEVIVDPDGSYRGILVDILDELNSRLGTRIRLQIDPIPRVIEKAQKKEVDGILSLHPGYADKLGLLKTGSYMSSYPAIFARKDVFFNRPSDFDGKRVAIIDKLFFSEKIMADHGKNARILRVRDAEEGLRLLENGQADIFLGATLNSYLINKYQLLNQSMQYIFFDEPINVVMGTRSDWPEFSTILDKGLSSFSKEEIEAITARWIHLPQPKKVIELTQEERVWLKQNHTVRVRVSNFPPYMFLEKDEITGIVIDYLNLIAQSTGVKFELVPETRPWQEALQSMMNLQGPDLMTSLSPIAERKPYMDFSEPYIVSPRVIFTRNDDKFISSIDGLNGRTLAVPHGTLVHKRMEMEYPDIRLLINDTDVESIEAVSKGKADAYIGNLINTSYEILHRGFTNLRVAAPSPFGDDVYTFGIRRDWPELSSIINKALDSISGKEQAEIRSKHFRLTYEHGVKPGDVLKWGLVVSGSALFLILLFVGWNRQLRRKVDKRTAEVVEREGRFRATFDQAAVGIAHVSPEGRFIRINRKFCDILGYSSDEMQDLTLQEITYPEDLEADIEHAESLLRGETETYSIEKRYVRKDGEIVWINLTVSLLHDDSGKPNYFVSVIKDISVRKQAEQKLKDYQHRLKSLVSQLTVAEDRERRAIAADLHDHVGHSLALARMQLKGILEATSDVEKNMLVNDISKLLLEASQDTRSLIFELSSPSMNEIGLSAAISDWLDTQIAGRHNLEVEFSDTIADDCKKKLDVDDRALLFRSVRELMTNVIKHARAHKVCVRLSSENRSVKIEVEDDGIGFDMAGTKIKDRKTGGFGLFSIEERMADLGGSCVVESKPGNGCRVVLTVPTETDGIEPSPMNSKRRKDD
jgi:PAS domain S-box-containing protein